MQTFPGLAPEKNFLHEGTSWWDKTSWNELHGPKFSPLQVNYLKKLGSSYDGNSPRNWEEADHNIFTVMQRLRGEVLENPYPQLVSAFLFRNKNSIFLLRQARFTGLSCPLLYWT